MSNVWKSPLSGVLLQEHTTGVVDNCECPTQFAGQEAEYRAIRESVGISDNCHYGKFRISGSDALDVVNRLVMGDVARLPIGRATWTFMLREDGSMLCDVYVLCLGDDYLLFTEGSDPAYIAEAIYVATGDGSVKVENLTQTVAIFAVDGPFAWELLKELVGVKMLGLRYLEYVEQQLIGGVATMILRSGKTGEYGYQIALPIEHVETVWNALLNAGVDFDAQPVGYDVLTLCRLENRFINMHCEGAASKNPLELNCRVMVDQEKDEYCGYQSLTDSMSIKVENRIIGIRIDGSDTDVPSIGSEVVSEGQVFGKIVNARYSPYLGKPIALALIASEAAFVGLDFSVVHGPQHLAAKTVSAPFVFNKSMTVRPQEDSYRNR